MQVLFFLVTLAAALCSANPLVEKRAQCEGAIVTSLQACPSATPYCSSFLGHSPVAETLTSTTVSVISNTKTVKITTAVTQSVSVTLTTTRTPKIITEYVTA